MSTDPLASARRLAAPPLPKRFYAAAAMESVEGGWSLRLDGKPALTPGRNPLVVAQDRLAQAIEAEWNGQGASIDPSTMPATRLVNTAIDGVAPRRAEVHDATAAYAASDLLVYRAGEPSGLVAAQASAWDPIVAWAERRYDVRCVLTEGVVHVAQPAETLARLGAAVRAVGDPVELAALNLATTLTGSALIALALREGEIDASKAWAAAHVDEDWNISQWGEDVEARARRDRRFADLQAAVLAFEAAEGGRAHDRPEEPCATS